MVLNITQRKGAKDVKDYYREESQGLATWFGKGAERLGLTGLVDRLVFNRLIDNKLPSGKGKLKPRTTKNGIVVWDFTFNCPKAFTLAALLAPEGRALKTAFVEAVGETMKRYVEPHTVTRVRIGGVMQDRITMEHTGALFIHYENRDANPHLHAHACILNHTWDATENRFKAAKEHAVYKTAPEIEKEFHKALREKTEALGYRTKDRGKLWDIAGLNRSTIMKFSERRGAIEALYETWEKITPARRKKAALMTRGEKPPARPLEEAKEDWLSQLTKAEKKRLSELKAKPKFGRCGQKNHLSYVRRAINYGQTYQRDYGRERAY